MTHIVVTGAGGFLGRHACWAFGRRPNTTVTSIDRTTSTEQRAAALQAADVVVHLAGANRPDDPADFQRINADLTAEVIRALERAGHRALVVLASSTQVGNGTPYAESKQQAEAILARYAANGGRAAIFRFPNLFGKRARPRYNSVVATFCDAIARGTAYRVDDAAREVTLLHVDDAVAAMIDVVCNPPASGACPIRTEFPTRRIALGDLAATIEGFRTQRSTLVLPDFGDAFIRALYSTYLSYLPSDEFAYDLVARTDPRGTLAEFIKSERAGQIFVSRTKPGIVRGNHWHETKVEKFLVLEGEAMIRFRAHDGRDVVEYPVRGEDFRVVDIPPGYAHSIENVGEGTLVTLFWASEIFDPARPDTYAEDVRAHG